ncbi:hypothetical protein J4052_08870 [Bacillus toyonensis]|nr:hypothetical protein [Bacillus toyonensis]
MAYESTRELIFQVINENRDLLKQDSQRYINMNLLLSDERLQHLSADILLKVVDELIKSGNIRCSTKYSASKPRKLLNFSVKEIY